MFGLFLAALMVPPSSHAAELHPDQELGLLNTFAGIVLPFFFMTPFAIFFLRQFFLGINREIEEAATSTAPGISGSS